MKRLIRLLIAFIILTLLWYLGDLSQNYKIQNGASTKEGILIKRNDQFYLVSNRDITSQEIEVLSIKELTQEYSSEIVKLDLSNAIIKNVKSGDRVVIWYTETVESYPGRIIVLKIEKV
ncbi:DUF3221 domain-containing protein (plasmid) [Rossellomorea marisflavi]|uniref:DUF3221 domain-containing protein n=1 Tax=Rossellomorea marisflavi TaxID=189381 RepID=UPI0013182EB3|nr:DUF3221 domain-containing protein [Rossellomorea marisflavi]QHA38750.1 DUF3221 domain-containing protein [Rossellomorea marisflavi]